MPPRWPAKYQPRSSAADIELCVPAKVTSFSGRAHSAAWPLQTVTGRSGRSTAGADLVVGGDDEDDRDRHQRRWSPAIATARRKDAAGRCREVEIDVARPDAALERRRDHLEQLADAEEEPVAADDHGRHLQARRSG